MWSYTIPAPLPQGWKVPKCNLHSRPPFGNRISLRLHPKWQHCVLLSLTSTTSPYFLTDFFWKHFLNKLLELNPWLRVHFWENPTKNTDRNVLIFLTPILSTIFNSTYTYYLPSYYNERIAFVLIKPTYLLILTLFKNCAPVMIVLSGASSVSPSLLANSHQETYFSIPYF